jgi:amino acid adenylation domain-containing protein
MSSFRRSSLDVALLHQSVWEQALTRPDAIAVEEEDRAVTYAELAATADRLAVLLRQGGVRRGDRVAILLDNGIEACIAILGILRADAAYVPINPATPPARVASILDQVEAAAALTVLSCEALLFDAIAMVQHNPPALTMVLDDRAPRAGATQTYADIATVTSVLPPNENIEADPVYLLFTSGSTGQSKGVVATHRSVKATIRWGVEYFQMGGDDRISNHSRLSFDVSMFDIFCAFYAGATLCPLTDRGECAFPGDFIRRRRITLWFSVPNVISMLSRSGQLAEAPFPTLRAALFAGEALTPTMVQDWKTHQPLVPIYNLFGPTEASIIVTVHNVGVDSPFDGSGVVPIGRAIRDAELFVLQMDRDEEADIGVTGRLVITGTQVTNGYWRRPDLSAAVFVPNPLKPGANSVCYLTGDLARRDADGLLYFLGRSDSQVKVNGFRVELGDVECAVGLHPAVNSVVAAVHGEPLRLVVFVTLSRPATVDDLYCHMKTQLPAYMVPTDLHIVQDMPVNDSGKIDRRALLSRE